MAEGTFRSVALTRLLNVEAEAGGADGGAVRGVAIAVGWWDAEPGPANPGRRGRRQGFGGQQPTPPEVFYLVSDMSRPAPIWLAASQVTRQYHGGTGPVVPTP